MGPVCKGAQKTKKRQKKGGGNFRSRPLVNACRAVKKRPPEKTRSLPAKAKLVEPGDLVVREAAGALLAALDAAPSNQAAILERLGLQHRPLGRVFTLVFLQHVKEAVPAHFLHAPLE